MNKFMTLPPVETHLWWEEEGGHKQLPQFPLYKSPQKFLIGKWYVWPTTSIIFDLQKMWWPSSTLQSDIPN